MSHPRRAAAAVLAATAVSLAAALPAQAATYNAFGGSAYATSAKIDGLVKSDKSSYVPLCTLSAPKTASNDTAALDLGVVGEVGAATTQVSSAKSGKNRTAQATTQVATTTLLGGIIQADAITSTATVTKTSKGYSQSGSSVFTDLTILGTPIDATPEPNTKIDVPGFATVVLNAQTKGKGSGGYTAGTTAMKVTLLPGNPLGTPTGTVVIGVANASLQKPTHALPYGSSYGTQLDASGIVGSGKTAAVYLPCGGTTGKTRSNAVASVNVPGVLKVGAVKSTGKSTDKSSATTATTTASLAKADLLDGTVRIDAVKVSAKATRDKKGKVKTTSSGTKITGLKINGQPVSVSTKENTEVAVPGVGTLYLHRVVKTKVSTTVYGAQLVLDTDVLGLDKGTTLTVGYAKAGVSAS